MDDSVETYDNSSLQVLENATESSMPMKNLTCTFDKGKVPKSLGNYICSICESEFPGEKQFYGHLQVHTGEILWKCLTCNSNTVFDSLSKLKAHENLYHNVVRPYKCEQCCMIFDRASQLDYHKRSVHLGEKSQICQICGKAFFRKTDLQTHLNIHLGTNMCICEVCGRKFNHVSNLIRHCRIHEGIKPYPCSLCGKRFTQINSLARHKRIHNKESNGSVDRTSKNVEKNKSSVTEKIKPPSQQKVMKRQHYCKICGDSFQFIVLLKQHEKLHTLNTDTFECKSCKKIFKKIDDIKAHRCQPSTSSVSPNNMKILKPEKHFIEKNSQSNKDKEGSKISLNKDKLQPLRINLEANESNMFLQEQFEDLSIKVNNNFPTNLDSENVTELLNNINCESFMNIKSVQEKDNVIYVQPLNLISEENNIFGSIENHEKVVDTGNKCVNFDKNQYYIEICDNSLTKNVEAEDFKDVEKEKNEFNEPTLRLVQTETGEQFYELIINHLPQDKNPNIKNNKLDEKIVKDFSSQSHDNIEFFEDQNENHFDYSNFEDHFLGENQCNTKKLDKGAHENSMIKLVENEKGEQYFEIVENHSEKNVQEENKCFTREKGGKKKIASKRFACTECSKTFSTRYNYNQHIGTHFQDKQKFQCKECNLSFAWKSTLNKHIANHHNPEGPPKFVCRICPKVYSTLSQVTEHVRRDHLKQRNHTCPYCGKSFFKKFDLKIHSRTHTNERPYICRSCGKRFHHQSHIIRHERIHSGEKPYSCNVCQKTFTQPSSLKAHKQRHQDIKLDILEYQMDEDDPLILGTL